MVVCNENIFLNDVPDCQRKGATLVIQSSAPGANPKIAIYKSSAVAVYNVTSSLVRFENKNVLFYFVKML
jgi:hypothetical protein